jgi:superfamily I DNA/RNA helicase
VVLILADQLGSGENDILQEERRLLYVALTRAEDVLVVTCATPDGEPITPILGELLSCGALRQG